MTKPFFTGTCTALVTPFLGNQVNYPMLDQLLKRQLEAGIEAVVVCGTTGEASTLTDEEKINIIRRCKTYAGAHCKIIAGTGSNNTAHAIALSEEAEKAKADGLLVVSPYYNKTNTEGLSRHYASIAKSVTIPMLLYNVPSRTGIDIPVSVYRQLSGIENIVGIKEANPDISKAIHTQSVCSSHFSLWSGNDETTVSFMALGAKGVISVLSNLYPEKMQHLTQTALAGDMTKAAQLQLELQPLLDLVFSDVNPIGIKAAMEICGYDCGGCRLPLTTLSPLLKQQLLQYFMLS